MIDFVSVFVAAALALGLGMWLGIRRERKYGAVVLEGEMDERYDEGYEAGFQEGRRVARAERQRPTPADR